MCELLTNPDEALYRSVRPDHTQGESVLAEAIRMPACSFFRHEPLAALDPELRPAETSIIQLLVGDLPPPIVPEPGSSGGVGKTFEFEAASKPERGREDHAEVRVRRAGESFSKNIPKKIRRLARDLIASRCTIVLR